MEVRGQLHDLAALPHGESPCYPMDRRLDGAQIHSGHGGEEKNSQPPLEIKPYYYLPFTIKHNKHVQQWK